MRIQVSPGSFTNIPNFNRSDFTCKCGCGLNNIQDLFIWRLQMTRTDANFPFIITSGCRCVKHNEEVGGASTSDHLSGEGADVKVSNGWQRLRIVDAALRNGIKRIGVARTFVHLGTNLKQNPEALWVY